MTLVFRNDITSKFYRQHFLLNINIYLCNFHLNDPKQLILLILHLICRCLRVAVLFCFMNFIKNCCLFWDFLLKFSTRHFIEIHFHNLTVSTFILVFSLDHRLKFSVCKTLSNTSSNNKTKNRLLPRSTITMTNRNQTDIQSIQLSWKTDVHRCYQSLKKNIDCAASKIYVCFIRQ